MGKRKNLTRRLKACLGVLWLLRVWLPISAQAHNGALAIAVPVEGVKVDGDLSDWTQDMRKKKQ